MVAGARAAVREGAHRRLELPVVGVAVQRELQYAPRVAVADLAVGLSGTEPVQPAAAGADHELANAVDGIRQSGGILGREALVLVVVTVDDDVRSRGVERLP